MSDDETQRSGERLVDASSSSSESADLGRAARVGGLWRKALAPRPARPPLPPRAVKTLVDGLDTTERNLGIGAVVLAIVLDLINFYVNRHSPTKAVRSAADFELIANLVFAGILALGLGLRRRALLGFGAFFFGLEQAFTEHELQLGLPFLVFGGWLILRASQKQKQARPVATSRGGVRSGAASTAGKRPAAKSRSTSAGRPKASKRYTPPQRARGGMAR